jgi:TPP-dependent pyruvate/acetoin dehydrogenase alpha subunit
MFDTELYRTKDEVEQWKERDPILLLVGRMQAAGILRDEELMALEESVAQEVDDSVTYAEAGSYEPVEDLTRFVTSQGRMP